jgi:hypothetical protein
MKNIVIERIDLTRRGRSARLLVPSGSGWFGSAQRLAPLGYLPIPHSSGRAAFERLMWPFAVVAVFKRIEQTTHSRHTGKLHPGLNCNALYNGLLRLSPQLKLQCPPKPLNPL